MKLWLSRFTLACGLCSAAFMLGADGCSDDEEVSIPTASAGEDITIALGEPAVLDGSGSDDPSHTGLLFHWYLESKPISSSVTTESFAANESADAESTSFVPDQPGTYGVSLFVESLEGALSDLDYVVVIAGSTNTLPVADAGGDTTVAVDQVAYVDGTGSSDPEGADLGYEWVIELVPAASTLTEEDLFNQGSSEAAIVPDVVGQYVLRLRVYDGEFWSAPDFVTVSATEDNQAPLANAGESWELTPCSDDAIEFDGRASYDPDGGDITYVWELVSAPAGSTLTNDDVNGIDTGTPTLTWDVVGLYTMRLVVNDGELDSDADYVAVRSVSHLPNDPPTADAGGDFAIYASAYCSGATCSPCGEREELLDGSASFDPDNDELVYNWRVLSGSATINGEGAEQAELVMPSMTTTNGNTSTATFVVELNVEDCQGVAAGDTDAITVEFNCYGQSY